MNATLLAALTPAERFVVSQTEREALAELNEDEVLELHQQIRRARNKYVGQYRRGASARVPAKGARGAARPANQKAALRAEAFEQALARVSRRLATLARQASRDLKAERLAAAQSVRWGISSGGSTDAVEGADATNRDQISTPRGDRATRGARTETKRGKSSGAGARRQAQRDSR